jgi:hypothetical protein
VKPLPHFSFPYRSIDGIRWRIDQPARDAEAHVDGGKQTEKSVDKDADVVGDVGAPNLSEEEIDLLAKLAHEEYGTTTVANLNKLLAELGF